MRGALINLTSRFALLPTTDRIIPPWILIATLRKTFHISAPAIPMTQFRLMDLAKDDKISKTADHSKMLRVRGGLIGLPECLGTTHFMPL